MKKTVLKLVIISLGFVILAYVYARFRFLLTIPEGFITTDWGMYIAIFFLKDFNTFLIPLIAIVYTAALYIAARERQRWFQTMLLTTVIVMAVTIAAALILSDAYSLLTCIEYSNVMFYAGVISMVLACAIKVVSVIIVKQTSKGAV
jgi:hypothetical protein